MANLQHIFSGTSDPGTIPTGIGHHYVNTVTKRSFVSIGISTVSDWIAASHVTTGTGAPSSTPAYVGDIYIDDTSTAEKAYIAVHTTDATGWFEVGSGGGGSGGTISAVTPATSAVYVDINANAATAVLTADTPFLRISITDAAGASLALTLPTDTDPLDSSDGLGLNTGQTRFRIAAMGSALGTVIPVTFYRADGTTALPPYPNVIGGDKLLNFDDGNGGTWNRAVYELETIDANSWVLTQIPGDLSLV